MAFATCKKLLCLLCILPVVLISLLTGCSAHRQYRTTLEIVPTNNPNYCFCTLERRTNWLLGFVEIDDQGWFWDRRSGTNQLEIVLDAIRAEETREQGLLIFTFIHGWKHNANFNDDYVDLFRRALTRLDAMEQKYSASNHVAPRKVIGVYVGWRGLSQDVPLLTETTFWGRKRTAHEVGRGAVAELFLRLESIVNESKRKATADPSRTASRLMIVGHSFGAGVVYSALAPLLMERILASQEAGATNAAPTRGFGDMVALVNPAFEAARFQVLIDAVRRHASSNAVATWPLNLAIFTSEADSATRVAFPMGRSFGTLFQSYQSREESRANHTAVGHYEPFITHTLSLTNLSTRKPPPRTNSQGVVTQQIDPGRKQKNLRRNNGTEDLHVSQATYAQNKPRMENPDSRADALRSNLYLGKAVLKPNTNAVSSPFIVARVSKRIIPDHNTIDRDTFMHVLSEFLLTLAPDERLKARGTDTVK